MSTHTLKQQVFELLRQNQLRHTEIRELILQLFIQKDAALSHSTILETLVGKFDRVTVYRSLKTFEEKGIIHRIADEGDTMKYALCKHDHHQHDHAHYDNHIHFKCKRCGDTFCLDEVSVPTVSLPNGWQPSGYQYLVLGTCPHC